MYYECIPLTLHRGARPHPDIGSTRISNRVFWPFLRFLRTPLYFSHNHTFLKIGLEFFWKQSDFSKMVKKSRYWPHRGQNPKKTILYKGFPAKWDPKKCPKNSLKKTRKIGKTNFSDIVPNAFPHAYGTLGSKKNMFSLLKTIIFRPQRDYMYLG